MPSKKQGKDKKKQKPPGKPMKKKGKAKPAKGKKGAKSEGSKKKKSTWLKRISSGEEAKSSVSIAPLSPPKEKETPTISRTTRLEYPTLDLMALTADEENIIKAVLNNDDEFQKLVDQKVSGLRNEIRIIRKKSSQETSKKKVTRKCIRCNQPLAIWRLVIPFLDKGARCQRCHFIVCQGCRHRQSNGLWLCALCVRYREIQYLTGEWFCKNKGLTGSDLVRFSLNKKDATFSHHEMPQESVPKEGLDSHKAAESLSEEDKSKVGKKDSIIKKDKHKGSLKAKTKEGKGKAAKGKGAKGKGAKDKGAKGKEGKTKPGKAPKGGKKPKKGKAPKGGKEHKGEKAPKGDKQKKGSKAGKNKSKNANENQRNMNVSYSNPEGQCHSIKCGTSDEKESEDEETYSKDTSRVDSGSNFSKSSHESLPIGASAAQLERTGRKQKAMPSSELFSQGTESSSKCYSRSVHGDSSLINISSYMIDDLCISFSDTENWIQYVRSKSPETYNVDTLRGRNHIRQSTEHVHKEKRKNKNSSIHSRRILKTDDDSIWNENCGNSRSMLSLGKIKGPTRSNRTRSKEKSKVQVNCIFDNANSSVHKLRYGNDEYSKAISANLNKYVSTALDEKSKYSAAISYPQEKHARKHSTCQISASCAKKIFLESHDFDFNMQSVSELHKNDSNRSEECAHLSSSEKGNTKQSKSEVTGTSNISSLPESDDEIIKMETESRGSNSRSSKSLNACGKEKNVNVANKKLFESFCKNTVVRRMRCLVAYFLDINESASSGLKRIVDVNVLDKNRNFHAEQSRGISPLQDKNDKPQEVYRRTSSLKDKDTTEKKKSISGKHGKGKKKEASDSKSSKDEKRKGSLRKSEDGKASTDRRPHASQGKTGKKNSVSGKRGKGKKKEASDSKSSKDEKRKGSLRKSEDGKASNDRKASTDRRPTSSIVAIGSMDPVLESDQKSPEATDLSSRDAPSRFSMTDTQYCQTESQRRQRRVVICPFCKFTCDYGSEF